MAAELMTIVLMDTSVVLAVTIGAAKLAWVELKVSLSSEKQKT